MTTYRTGNHWGVTIVAETEVGVGGGRAHLAQLVAVVVNGDQALAERICTLLNGEAETLDAIDRILDDYRGPKALREGIREIVWQARARQSQNDPGCVYPDGVCTCGEPEGHPRCGWCTAEGHRCPSCSDGDGPSRPLSSPLSASGPELVVGSANDCDCGHEGLPAEWHSRPCPLAKSRFARGGRIPSEAPPRSAHVECKLVRLAGPGPTEPCACRPSQPCAMAVAHGAPPADSCTCAYWPNGVPNGNPNPACPRHGAVI